MIETDFRKQKDVRFLSEHELNDDQLEKLIEEKFKRARAYYEALHKRKEEAEILFDWSQRGIGNEVLVTHAKQ